ncbi:MAG: dihydrodipicolinate reductase [Candidatus Micrarchaeota archaeon]|nr:dihydrodipicolinate reductase [Candidatus Micrarchaeota archaeon]
MLNVFLSGTGKMGNEVTRLIEENREDINLLDIALSGRNETKKIGDLELQCFGPEPEDRKRFLRKLEDEVDRLSNGNYDVVGIDFSTPGAGLQNVRFFCENRAPFVMGTTGFDHDEARRMVEDSSIPAVIAPNMCKEIVLLNEAIEYLANMYPGAFKDLVVRICESHQKRKKDTSGTAKKVRSYLEQLTENDVEIVSIRDPDIQDLLGVPEKYLDGHAYHWFVLKGKNKKFIIIYKIHGRRPYAEGSLDAARFVDVKNHKNEPGYYEMTDVLREIGKYR